MDPVSFGQPVSREEKEKTDINTLNNLLKVNLYNCT